MRDFDSPFLDDDIEYLRDLRTRPKPFHIPFWKLLQHKQGRKARRIKR